MASVLNMGRKPGEHPFQAIIMNDILPYYKGDQFENKEKRLLEKFEKAIHKDHIKFINYKDTDFYMKNSIALKIAYDFDVSDPKSVEFVKPLFVNEETKTPDMFIPSPSFPELANFQYFPRVKYDSNFREDEATLKYDYETQFFSIIGKVNKKLALSEKFDLIPIIINDNIHNYYQYKINKSKKSEDENFNLEWSKTHNYELMNLNSLIFKSSSIFIKNDQLRTISISEILDYKNRCINDLYKLRKELFSEINNIVKTNFNSNDLTEVNRLIGKKIIPEFYKYQESQNSILTNTIKKTIKYSIGFGSAYFGFVQGLSPILIALLSGTSPLFAEDMLQLSDKLKDKKKRQYENTFSYFLNLDKNN